MDRLWANKPGGGVDASVIGSGSQSKECKPKVNITFT